MKGLFIYYSLSGNGDLVAEKMKEKGYDIRPVRLKKPMPKKFFSQIMAGGFLAGNKVAKVLPNNYLVAAVVIDRGRSRT